MKKRVLLHACCGPCAEYPLQMLMQDDFAVTVYYYNPNIHPIEEWKRRLAQLEYLTTILGLDLIVDGSSEPDTWLGWDNQGKPDRCRMCYERRLGKTAAKAAELGMDAFLSTLQVSPYQDFDLLIRVGEKYAHTYALEFIAADFRSGFRQGQNMAREDGLYRQRYCGCAISLDNSSYREKILRELEDLKVQQ